MAAEESDNPFQAPPAEGEAEAEAKKPKGIMGWSDVAAARTLRITNMFNGLALMALATVTFILDIANLSFTGIIVSVYLIFFGLMLICVELNIANLQPRLKAQVGFIFTFAGRSTFILFAASLAIALAAWPGYLVGAISAANAIFNMYVICVHPAWKSGGRFHKGDITVGYSTAEDVAIGVIKENPDMAFRAGAAAGRYVADNPEMAKKAAYGAAKGATDAREEREG